MGFDNARLVLDRPNNTYYSGQTVNGRLIFSRDKVKKFRGIYVHFRGYCKVHWTASEREGRTDNFRTVIHDSYEEYFNQKIYLVGTASGDHHLPAGQHDLPFSIHVPNNCPSALEYEFGCIRYELRVVVDRAFKADQELTAPIVIIPPLDLNMVPNARERIEMKIEESYCCWCVSAGSSETLIKLPTTGYAAGQVIPVEICCINRSTDELDIKVSIKKDLTFNARNEPGTKNIRSTILEEKRGPVPSHLTRTWTIELVVPEQQIHNLENCSFIDVKYELKVKVCPDGCHDDAEDSCYLILGTIPIGSSLPVQNHQPVAPAQAYPQAITQQPFANSYQQPNTYPGGIPTNSPYPAPNPYPGTIPTSSPYPLNPYPGTAPTNTYPAPNPYPGTIPSNTPYPGPTSPYPPNPYPPSPQKMGLQTAPNMPISESPYAPQNSPYPITPPSNPPQNTGMQNPNMPPNSQGQNPPPYPITSPSNVSQNTPNMPQNSQGQNPPYPITPPSNPPYADNPNRRSPYPTSPYPGVQTTGLKTGTLGFVHGDSGVNIPLLPVGAVPMPKPEAPANPYAASAPEPSTPDDVTKPIISEGNLDQSQHPAYNPAFANQKA